VSNAEASGVKSTRVNANEIKIARNLRLAKPPFAMMCGTTIIKRVYGPHASKKIAKKGTIQ
jgi:hypothetical protein